MTLLEKYMLNLESFSPDFTKIFDQLKLELKSLRTGRASAVILDAVMVEVYGQRLALKGLASISVPDPKTIVIDPWDKNILKDIEKAIVEAKIGLQPINEGKSIRLVMPLMTEETRQELIKILGQKLEQTRISIRQLRDKIREQIFKEEKEKLIGEDQRFRLQQKLDEMSKDYNEKIKLMGEEKEREIMVV